MLIRIFVVGLLLVAGVCAVERIVWGHGGIVHVNSLRHQIASIKQQIVQLDHEIESDTKIIQTWHEHDFCREKFGREHLALARPGDRVYLV